MVAGGSTDSGSDHYVTLSLLSRWWFQHLVLLDEVKMVVCLLYTSDAADES